MVFRRFVKTSIDKGACRPVFHPFLYTFCVYATLPGSSVAEQVTVNHLVAGSIPARAAISPECSEVTADAKA